jgi:PAS domain-containing protein
MKKREVHIESKVISDVNNLPIRMTGTFQDITERKRMEMELESIVHLAQENPSPVMRLSQGHKINYSNPAAQVLLTD